MLITVYVTEFRTTMGPKLVKRTDEPLIHDDELPAGEKAVMRVSEDSRIHSSVMTTLPKP
jgi:hypothetical protein